MSKFIPDLLLSWANYELPAALSEIKHQQATVCRTLGSDFKVGKESEDSIAFWDSKIGISVLFAKTHLIVSMQLPQDNAKEKWDAFAEVTNHALALSSVPEKFSNFTCNARSYYSTSDEVDESMQHTEKIMQTLSHGRPVADLLNMQVIDRQGVNEVQYQTVQNTQTQQYGVSLIYSRTSDPETPLSKDDIIVFLEEENVIEQVLDEQKRLDDIAQKAIKPTDEA